MGAGRGALLLLLGLAALACSVPRPIPSAQLVGWQAVRTPEFQLIGDASAAELERLARDLVVFEAVFRQLASLPRNPKAAPVPLFAIEDHALGRRFWVGVGTGAAGWMLPTLSGSYAAVGVVPNHSETRRVLFHEYTHVLLRENRRAPLATWYDEGLSQYFATLSLRDGAAVVGAVPGQRLGRLGRRRPFPLERLFGAGISTLSWREIDDFYATSWALSHYLLASPSRRAELAAFAAGLERGTPWRKALAASFDRTPEALQAALQEHIELLARGVPLVATIDPGAAAARPLAATPLASEEVAFELGRLALALGTESESRAQAALARTLFERAYAARPGSPRIAGALAEARALDGDVEEARPLVAEALASAPQDSSVWLHAGRVELAHAEAFGGGDPELARAVSAAEAAYQRALELDPTSAPGWFGLGRSAQHGGRSEAAVSAFERARQNGWSAALDLELGTLHLEQGRTTEARALLLPIAQDPHGGPQTEKARERLDDAGLGVEEDAEADTPDA